MASSKWDTLECKINSAFQRRSVRKHVKCIANNFYIDYTFKSRWATLGLNHYIIKLILPVSVLPAVLMAARWWVPVRPTLRPACEIERVGVFWFCLVFSSSSSSLVAFAERRGSVSTQKILTNTSLCHVGLDRVPVSSLNPPLPAAER